MHAELPDLKTSHSKNDRDFVLFMGMLILSSFHCVLCQGRRRIVWEEMLCSACSRYALPLVSICAHLPTELAMA